MRQAQRGLRPRTPAGKGRKALPGPLPILPFLLPTGVCVERVLARLGSPESIGSFVRQDKSLVGVWGQRPQLIFLAKILSLMHMGSRGPSAPWRVQGRALVGGSGSKPLIRRISK
jgi:hypothetical protein